MKNGASAIYWFTCFYYVLMISSLDHKKVFKCVPNCSKSTVISLDFCHFVLMKKMRFSYVLIISSECNKSRWSLQMTCNTYIFLIFFHSVFFSSVLYLCLEIFKPQITLFLTLCLFFKLLWQYLCIPLYVLP